MTAGIDDPMRALVLSCLEDPISSLGLSPDALPDDFDMLAEGVIDSLGFIKLITEIETRLGFAIGFDDLDPDQLTVLGPLCRYLTEKRAQIAAQSGR